MSNRIKYALAGIGYFALCLIVVGALWALAGCATTSGKDVKVDGGAATLGAGIEITTPPQPERDPLATERDISACGGMHEKGAPEYCGCLRRHGAAGDHEYAAYCEKEAKRMAAPTPIRDAVDATLAGTPADAPPDGERAPESEFERLTRAKDDLQADFDAQAEELDRTLKVLQTLTATSDRQRKRIEELNAALGGRIDPANCVAATLDAAELRCPNPHRPSQ